MDVRRNQLIVGGVVIVAVIVVIALVASKSGDAPVCELQAEQPKIDLSKVKIIIAGENNVLLKFAGYVKYEKSNDVKDDKIYLALEDTQTVALKKDDVTPNQPARRAISAETGCASLTLNIDQSSQPDKLEIGTVKLEVKADGLKKPDDESYCTVSSIGEAYAKDKHYSCNKEKSYPCKDKDKTVATLVVSNLEFELDGNPEKVKKGEFTTAADECH